MESESSEEYFSDQIDPEIEVSLYGLIHHHLEDDNNKHLFNNHLKQDLNNINIKNNINDNKRKDELNDNCFKANNGLNYEKTQIFQNKRQKVSHEIENKRKIECIQIDDSSEDSDVIIISDNESESKSGKLFESKGKRRKCESKTKANKPAIDLDISFANVNNLSLKESSILQMEKFYNEDIYDSEEESNAINNMSNDKKNWKIHTNDILLSTKKSNRYYRNKFLCTNCSERGHEARDCPLPKKIPICYLCGNSGHLSQRCSSVICAKCLSSRHRTINCNVLVNQLVCSECGVRGHQQNNCTNNWRKYHMTTSAESEPTVTDLPVNERVSCYNCGAFGKHYGHECRSKTINNLTPPSPLLQVSSKLLKKSNCFNGKMKDSSTHSIHNGNIVSNDSNSSLNASFDERLSSFNLSQNSITSITSYKGGNKHIKWIYPETSTPLIREKVFQSKPLLNEHSVDSHISLNEIPLVLNSAQTDSYEEINISMLDRSERTPTKRFKRNKREIYVERHQLLKETNFSSNDFRMKKRNKMKRKNRKLNKKNEDFKNFTKLNTIMKKGKIESF